MFFVLHFIFFSLALIKQKQHFCLSSEIELADETGHALE